MLLLLTLLVPTALAFAHEKTGRYPFSALVTLSCAVIVCLCGKFRVTWPIIAGLLLSVAGDWFMAHRKAGGMQLLYGIGFFFAAHAFFSVYSIQNRRFTWLTPTAAVVIFLAIGLYAFRRALPHIHAKPIQIGLLLYAGISALSLTLASSQDGAFLPRALFFAAIMLIAVSDIFISENDFLRVKKVGKWICPLYYACHILMTASVITRTGLY